MVKQKIRVGTRASPLALKQVEEIDIHLKKFYPKMHLEVVKIDTLGDKDRTTPISDIEGTDFFTREIEQALLDNEIDCAVHSAKDLPDKIPSGLVIAAITKSIDPLDALVSKNNLKLSELPQGAAIGASSERRKKQLKIYRSDFQLVDIRGNIEERLRLLEHDTCLAGRQARQKTHDPRRNLDAIVVAACALTRLGLEQRITQRIPFEILQPHPLQGALATEARENDKELIHLLKVLDGR